MPKLGMAEQRSLVVFAHDCEDVATGLHTFRDSLPRSATRITAIISELFAVSSILREIDSSEGDVRFSSSFYRVQDDLKLLFATLRRTLDSAFNMFSLPRERARQVVWDDLCQKMEQDEGLSFLDRLETYHDFLRGQADILQGHRSQDLNQLRKELASLLNAQEVSALQIQRLSIDTSARNTLRRNLTQPRATSIESPLSPVSTSDSWSDYMTSGRLPPAPDPPGRMPTSPTNTSNSSHTFTSSQTSYTGDRLALVASPPLIHWAQDIFDGQNPCSRFASDYQLDDRTVCQGNSDASSLDHLVRDGFVEALSLPFDRNRFLARLYFRPADSRARILLTNKEAYPRELHFCTPMTNLKVIRKGSCLQLCRAKGGRRYSLWAKLNFYFYERMALFYCTFVAMKRQDSRPVPHEDLLEDFELEQTECGEVEEFGGQMQHGDLLHALRLYRDGASGVVRIEASALRGPMKDVPLWTAFITKYAHDPDWAHFEGDGVVSLVALKPPPYVFLSGYEPPRDTNGQYVLHFVTNDDAREFVQTWTGFCRANH